jgi:hypothetical protein
MLVAVTHRFPLNGPLPNDRLAEVEADDTVEEGMVLVQLYPVAPLTGAME